MAGLVDGEGFLPSELAVKSRCVSPVITTWTIPLEETIESLSAGSSEDCAETNVHEPERGSAAAAFKVASRPATHRTESLIFVMLGMGGLLKRAIPTL